MTDDPKDITEPEDSDCADAMPAAASFDGAILVVRTEGPLPRRRRAHAKRTPDERVLDVLGRAISSGAPPVSRLALDVELAAMAPATKLAIAADLECWLAWCAHENRAAVPADPEDLVRYLVTLEADGKKPATLERRLASIASLHKMLSVRADNLPTAAPIVRSALRGHRRRHGAPQRQAAPLRLGGELGEVPGFTITALLAACASDLQGVRDAALLSLGYDAGLRVSELTAVTLADLRPQLDGAGLLYLPRSKTDQQGQGAWAWLSPETMRRVGQWCSEADITEGVVFRRVGVDRRRQRAKELADERWGEDGTADAAELVTYTVGSAPLSRPGVTGIYRRVALAAARQGHAVIPAGQLDAAIAALSTHSLRVGLTQDLLAAGEDGLAIAQALRWSSPSTALRYGARLRAENGAASRVLAQARK